MEEPSVLDYLKSLLMPWKYPKIELPPASDSQADMDKPLQAIASDVLIPEKKEPHPTSGGLQTPTTAPTISKTSPLRQIPWSGIGAVFFALAGQAMLAPRPERSWTGGVVLYLVAIALLLLAIRNGDWKIPHGQESNTPPAPAQLNLSNLLIGLVFSLAAFISFSDLRFNALNLSLLSLSLFFVVKAFWLPEEKPGMLSRVKNLLRKWRKSNVELRIRFTANIVIAALICGIVLFFRYYRLGSVPPEMNSDHAEKLLDSMRVFMGQYMIFFPNNGGREALEMYLVAAMHRFWGIDMGFMILKLFSTAIGLLALPYLYLIGVEVGNRRIGWIAVAFAGISYWLNVVARFGLRLPFYMLFSAATLYYLIHGLRTGRRRDFIFSGISLGISFYGYSADRILPLLIVCTVCLFLLHMKGKKQSISIITSTIALVFISFVLFIPLLRYILADPNSFLFRTLTRMGSLERPLPGPAWQIFLSNMGRALAMFSWSGGEIWPISIPHYPALGVVSGGLFYLGLVLTITRYILKRHWLDAVMLLSIPILLLPSVLALAFPSENPNLYRTGGVFVPVFIFIGLALDGLLQTFQEKFSNSWGLRAGGGFLAILFLLSAWQNYGLVFDRYYTQYLRSAWNSSEMGQVIQDFSSSFGHPDQAWVIGYPYWVDTRLVGINAGFIMKDYQIFPDQLDATLEIKGTKLFILNPQDEVAIERLQSLYPEGWFRLYKSQVETKDFLIFIAPPDEGYHPPIEAIPDAESSENSPH